MIVRENSRAWISSIGARDRYITIQQATETRGSAGGIVQTWARFAGVWAARRDLSAKEFQAAQQTQYEITTEYRIAWRSDITAKMRIVDGTQTYNIESIADLGGQKVELVLLCREVT